MSLTTKIFLGFLALLGSFALLAFFSVQQIRAVADDLRAIKDGHIALARRTARLETLQKNRFRDLRRALEEDDPRNQQVVLRIARHYFPEITQGALQDVRDAATKQALQSPRARALGADRFASKVRARVDAMASLHGQVDDLTARLLERVDRGEPIGDDAVRTLGVFEKSLSTEAYELNKDVNDEMDDAVRRAEDDERAAVWRVVVMTAVALAIGLFLTWMAARALSPIRPLVRYARAISRGDYEQTIAVRGDGELASLAEELRLMARSRKDREEELDVQAGELERAYRRVEELKRYHESIVRSLRTGVVVTNTALEITSTNRAAEAHWSLAFDEVRGQRLDALPVGGPLAEQVGPLDALVEARATVNAEAVPLGELLADVTIAPLENDKGAVLGLVVALEDVTDAVRTKEALIRSERLAAIGRMSAHVTHEIRNPLSSIGLNAEMLEGITSEAAAGQDADDAKALCGAIVREVDRLTAITEEYLRFARLPQPELSRVDVGDMLSAIEAFVRRDCAAAGVEVKVDLPETPLAAQLDGDQIRQSLLNLVRNAKESMPEGGVLTLGARADEARLTLWVADGGVGIPAADLERIFDPFYSTKLTGTGLGLALTQQIVSEHGGALEVDSEVGRGTEFRIVLPLVQPPKITALIEDSDGVTRVAS